MFFVAPANQTRLCVPRIVNTSAAYAPSHGGCGWGGVGGGDGDGDGGAGDGLGWEVYVAFWLRKMLFLVME